MFGFFGSGRALRILPPYYVAMGCSLGILFLARWGMNAMHIVSGDHTLMNQVEPGNIATHLLLIQNWFPRWIGEINGTHWSVAAEWQIYFLFPFLLLPLWRRFGGFAVVSAGLGLGTVPLLLLPSEQNFSWTCPQYIGLFAMGMVGATINFSQGKGDKRLQDALPWGGISGVLFCFFLFYHQVYDTRHFARRSVGCRFAVDHGYIDRSGDHMFYHLCHKKSNPWWASGNNLVVTPS